MTFDIALKNIGSRLCQQRYILGLAIIWVGFVYCARGVVPDFWWKFVAVLLQITVFAFWGIGGMAKSQQTDTNSFVRSIAFKPIIKIKVADILLIVFLLLGVGFVLAYLTDYNDKLHFLFIWVSFGIIPASSGIISEAILLHYAMKDIANEHISKRVKNTGYIQIRPDDLVSPHHRIYFPLGMAFMLSLLYLPESGYFNIMLPRIPIGYTRFLSVLLVGVIIISCYVAHWFCVSTMILLHSSIETNASLEKPLDSYLGLYYVIPACVLFLGLSWLLFIFHIFFTVLL